MAVISINGGGIGFPRAPCRGLRLTDQLPNLPFLVIEFLAFLLAISVHEAAHALVADLRGDDTARLLGRITLNPVRHVELFGSVIFPLVGLISGGMILGWAKPTPIDPRKLKQPRKDDILISLAGPASNILLALVSVAVLYLLYWLAPAATMGALSHLGHPRSNDSFWVPLTNFVYYSMALNVLLAVFNLIPIPPLDGSHVLRHFLPRSLAEPYQRLYQNSTISFVLLIGAIYIGIPNWLFDPALRLFNHLLNGI